MAEFQSWLKSSDRKFTAILQGKHLLFHAHGMPRKPYVTKVGVGSEIVDFTSCSPTWSTTSIIAP
jgi:hypothetical protein